MIPLLPEKHVRLNETILGLGALVMQQLEAATTLDQLWEKIKEIKTRKKAIPERIDFDDIVLTIDVLFALKAIEMNDQGELRKCV